MPFTIHLTARNSSSKSIRTPWKASQPCCNRVPPSTHWTIILRGLWIHWTLQSTSPTASRAWTLAKCHQRRFKWSNYSRVRVTNKSEHWSNKRMAHPTISSIYKRRHLHCQKKIRSHPHPKNSEKKSPRSSSRAIKRPRGPSLVNRSNATIIRLSPSRLHQSPSKSP